MTTNTKEIIARNQRHLRSFFHASDYGTKTNAEAFVAEVKRHMRGGYGYTPYDVIYQMAWGGNFLVGTEEIVRYLKSLGLYDEERIYKFRNYRNDGPTELYASLLARDGAKLYDAYMAGKNPLAVKKKKTVKRNKVRANKMTPAKWKELETAEDRYLKAFERQRKAEWDIYENRYED